MHKAFKYRLKPTAKQATTLAAHLEECRMLYNHFVVDRIQADKDRGASLGRYDQINQLPFLKTDRSTLAQVHSQVLQNVTVRVDWAFQAFYRRCKEGGKKPGFPRFKGVDRYGSLTYPQATAFHLDDQGLWLAKIGCLRGVWSRPLEGTPKTCTIRRHATGKWYATIVCEVEVQSLSASDEMVGIDVGLVQFVTLSNGETTTNPQFFRQDEKALAKAQRKLAKAAMGTPVCGLDCDRDANTARNICRLGLQSAAA